MTGADKRVHTRIPVRIPCKVALPAEENAETSFGLIGDLSIGGVSFLAEFQDRILALNDAVVVTLTMQGEEVVLRGQIAWVKRQVVTDRRSTRVFAGVRLVSPSLAVQRLIEGWIESALGAVKTAVTHLHAKRVPDACQSLTEAGFLEVNERLAFWVARQAIRSGLTN